MIDWRANGKFGQMLGNFHKRDQQRDRRVKLLLRDFETDLLGEFATGVAWVRKRRCRVLRRVTFVGNEAGGFEETMISRRQPRRQQQQNQSLF